MRRNKYRDRGILWLVVSLLGIAKLLSFTSSASAVEYRLQVVNLYTDAFMSYLRPGELADGVTGPGLERLIANLDRGEAPAGTLLYDRPFQPASEATTKVYGAVPIGVDVRVGGRRRDVWDEARWKGKPGERSIWIVSASSRQPQRVVRVVLKVVVVNDNSALNQELPLFDAAYGGAQRGRAREMWGFTDVDSARVAESLGCLGIRVEHPKDLHGALETALAANRPVVVDAVTDVHALADRAWTP